MRTSSKSPICTVGRSAQARSFRFITATPAFSAARLIAASHVTITIWCFFASASSTCASSPPAVLSTRLMRPNASSCESVSRPFSPRIRHVSSSDALRRCNSFSTERGINSVPSRNPARQTATMRPSISTVSSSSFGFAVLIFLCDTATFLLPLGLKRWNIRLKSAARRIPSVTPKTPNTTNRIAHIATVNMLAPMSITSCDSSAAIMKPPTSPLMLPACCSNVILSMQRSTSAMRRVMLSIARGAIRYPPSPSISANAAYSASSAPMLIAGLPAIAFSCTMMNASTDPSPMPSAVTSARSSFFTRSDFIAVAKLLTIEQHH